MVNFWYNVILKNFKNDVKLLYSGESQLSLDCFHIPSFSWTIVYDSVPSWDRSSQQNLHEECPSNTPFFIKMFGKIIKSTNWVFPDTDSFVFSVYRTSWLADLQKLSEYLDFSNLGIVSTWKCLCLYLSSTILTFLQERITLYSAFWIKAFRACSNLNAQMRK